MFAKNDDDEKIFHEISDYYLKGESESIRNNMK